MGRLGKCSGTTRLNNLDLGRGQRNAPVSRSQLVAVECVTLRRLDGSELGAGVPSNAVGTLDRLAKRSELLGVVAVGAERGVGRGLRTASPTLGEGVCRRSRVRVRCVVNG